ncbi:MAG: GNAT family protein [Kineosporiaceae bacterium]
MSGAAASAPLVVRLETERLLLRPLQHGDEDALFALFGDPQVMRYWNTPPWVDPARASAMIASDAEAAADGSALRLGIVPLGAGTVVGTVSLFALDHANRRGEVGYALRYDCWGRGYATEAVGALVRWAFGELGLHRLEADIDPRNTASAAVLTRLGFRLEGVLRERWFVAGEVSDSAMYGLLAHEVP